MANHRLSDCNRAEQNPLERVKYFRRQLLTEADMTTDQDYFRQKHRRHNRFLHGWGTVCGLEVFPVQGLCVEIQPGYALGPYGDEIFVPEPVRLDLAACGGEAMTDPCEPSRVRGAPPSAGRETVYVAIRYAECLARPVRAMPAGCGCEEEVCEYSRIRDSFEIACLDQLPVSHLPGEPMQFCELLETRQVIPCPSCPEDPWVVLATIPLPALGDEISTEGIRYMDRRQILSTAMLQEWLYACCCENMPLPPLPRPNLRCDTGINSINLHWDWPLGEGVIVHLERFDEGEGWVRITEIGDRSMYTDGPLMTGTTYRYRVRAYCDSDDSYSMWSTEAVCATQQAGAADLVLLQRPDFQPPHNVSFPYCNVDENGYLVVRIRNDGDARSGEVLIAVTYPGTEVTGEERIEDGIEVGEIVERRMISPSVGSNLAFTTFTIRVTEGGRDHAFVESECFV